MSLKTVQTLKGNQCEPPILQLLFVFAVHCAVPSLNEASLITMVLLKTGGNAGWFAG